MINIYCDESCHLEHDNEHSMLLGALSCESVEKNRIYQGIRQIKIKHNLSSWAEVKWTAVSPSKLDLYLDLIDYFINENHLNFRSVIIKDKKNLDHVKYNNGSHDLWYYKAYYYLLDAIIAYKQQYKIFLDIKDTRGGPKVEKLKEVLCNNKYDFKQEVITGIYQISSHESEIMQLTDLIMGAIGYYHNYKFNQANSSTAKNAIVDKLISHYDKAIVFGTSRGATKMDIFLWELKG